VGSPPPPTLLLVVVETAGAAGEELFSWGRDRPSFVELGGDSE